ncbi:MAG: lipid II flippase MurJ [bacterium]
MSLGATGFRLAVLRALNSGLGLLLSIGLAAVFGVSREVDALFVAMAVAVFLARDLSRVIRTAAVPCLVESDEGHGPKDFAENFQIVVIIAAASITLLIWVGAPLIVKLTSPGFDAAAAHDAQRLLRMLAPSLLLFLLFGSAQSVFHARRLFVVPELGETLWRVIAIVSLFTLGRHGGIMAYTLGLTVAAFSQWLLLFVWGTRKGFQMLPTRWVPVHPRHLLPFWLGAIVVLCSVIQMQVEGVLDRAMMSFMAPGSIALFSYADRLARMMPFLLSTSLLIPWLPEMVRIHARIADPNRLAKQGSLFLSALGMLLAVVIAWAARDIVTLLLLRGKFDAPSSEIVIVAVRIFALSIPAIYCVQCLAGLYVIRRDLKGMVGMGLLAVFAHAIGNLLLRHQGVPGIALSGSVSVWIVAGYLWWRIPTRERVWFAWGRFAGAMAAVLVILFAIPWTTLLPWSPARVVVGALAAWAAYTAIMRPAIHRMQAYEREATAPTPADAGAAPSRPKNTQSLIPR